MDIITKMLWTSERNYGSTLKNVWCTAFVFMIKKQEITEKKGFLPSIRDVLKVLYLTVDVSTHMKKM